MTDRGRVRVSKAGNANLNEVRTQDHEFYLGFEDADGTIHLVPAMLIPAALLQPLQEKPESRQLGEGT